MANKKTAKSGKTSAGRGRPKGSTTAATTAKTVAAGKRQVWALVLFAVGLLIFFITLIPGESLWLWMHNAFLGLFSGVAYGVAPLVIYTAVMLTLDRPFGSVGGKLAICFLLLLELCGMVHLFLGNDLKADGFFAQLGELYQGSIQFTYGGVFALPFGVWLKLGLGTTGGLIFLFLLVFVTVMLLTGITLGDFLKLCAKPAKKIGDSYARQAEANAQTREEKAKARADRGGRFAIDVPIENPEIPSDPLPTDGVDTSKGGKAKLDGIINAFGGKKKQKEQAVDLPFDEEDEEDEDGEMILPPDSAPQVNLEGIAGLAAKAAQKAQEDLPAGAEEEKSEGEGEGAEPKPAPKPEKKYQFPPLSLLKPARATANRNLKAELEENGAKLVQILDSFGVSTRVIHISRGPAVTRYELQPNSGVKISKITNLADDIALNLAASGVRIEAPIPGKAAVGIEVPNKTRSAVALSEVVGSADFKEAKSKLSVALGRDIGGKVALGDIAGMPHVLIAGATGSGKSVCINTIIMSILYKSTPDEVKLLLIDPKVVELGIYNGIPHLLVPVVTDARKASGALGWAVTEMMNRYKLFAEANVRDIKGYNAMADQTEGKDRLPQIVVIIDELADLMMVAPSEVEDAICRLAQMARAAGMHLIIATQRPSVDVITGLIKANIPSRISFAVSSQIDSRTILDASGAEKLLGRGDMLFKPMGESKAMRIQGCFVSDEEIEKVIGFLSKQQQANYDEQIMEEIDRLKATEKGKGREAIDGDETEEEANDPMLLKAIECVVEAGIASTSLLQRRLKLGYARAARIVDIMEQRGVVGPFEGSKPRKVLITKQQLQEMLLNNTEEA